MKRFVLGLAALLAVGLGVAFAQVSTPNYTNQAGWHVGGVLEVLDGGTLRLSTGTKTATATAGAATLNKLSGKVTSEALTTAAGASYTLTLTNSQVAAADILLVTVGYGTATTGEPVVARVNPGAGTATIVIRNSAAAAAVNGTLVVSFAVVKA